MSFHAKGVAFMAETGKTEESNAALVTETRNGVPDSPENVESGEDLNEVQADGADDDWYKKGNVYTDDAGRRLEVFFDDDGMLQFAVDGLSLYDTMADRCQQENNWKIYTCDDGTMIVYYPGDPAYLEISDGEYAGLYKEGGDKVK